MRSKTGKNKNVLMVVAGVLAGLTVLFGVVGAIFMGVVRTARMLDGLLGRPAVFVTSGHS